MCMRNGPPWARSERSITFRPRSHSSSVAVITGDWGRARVFVQQCQMIYDFTWRRARRSHAFPAHSAARILVAEIRYSVGSASVLAVSGYADCRSNGRHSAQCRRPVSCDYLCANYVLGCWDEYKLLHPFVDSKKVDWKYHIVSKW